MNKDIIKLLIVEYQKNVTEVLFQERPVMMDDNLNYVFVGLRRAGKSYLMYQQINHLIRTGRSVDEMLQVTSYKFQVAGYEDRAV